MEALHPEPMVQIARSHDCLPDDNHHDDLDGGRCIHSKRSASQSPTLEAEHVSTVLICPQDAAATAPRPSAQPAQADTGLSEEGVAHGNDGSTRPDLTTILWPSPSVTAQPGGNSDSSRPTPVAVPQPSHSATAQPGAGDDDDSSRPDLIAIPWPSPSAAAQPPASADSAQAFPIRWPSKCGKEYSVRTEWYDFGKTSDLHIQEAIHQLDGSYRRVAGWVHIAQAPAEQAPGTVKVKMSYAISSTVSVNSVKYSRTPTGLVIGDPSFPDGFDGVRAGKACLGMSVVIYVASGASMKTLKIASNHMGMQIHRGANFTVTDSTSISLTTGTLDAVSFDSRQTHLKTISGSISGKFALRDLLSIVTKSGSVNIDVEPREAAPGSSNPAVFMVDSLSGSIRTDFKRKRIPERDYQTFVNTTVGSVDGSFIHGSRTEMNSVAGLITADILPFKSGDYQSEIYTHTHSGQTSLTLRSPYKAKRVPMNGLVSTHKSSSGGLAVTYPQEWTGHIDGTSLSGALHLQGKELELLNENDTPGKNHVEAKKGNGASTLSFDTTSGECEIKIGKV